jgi:RimJ/RimL family protein N-acetyltransferase
MAYRPHVLQPSYPLTSPRLVLRPYEATDLPALHAMFGREDLCRYLPWGPMTLDQARDKLAQRLRQTGLDADGDAIVLAAIEAATGQHVGEFMLRRTNEESRQGEIGWSLHPSAHGRGLATEGARAMLRLGFEEGGFHRITAGSDPRNTASVKVMERLGMRREALFVENWFLKGEWVGEIVCALLEPEWRRSGG